MIKVKISADRFADACNVIEYINVTNGSKETAMRLIPRFVLGDDGEYIVKVTLDADGDIAGLEGLDTAFLKLSAMTPKRLEQLSNELTEAAKAIVNPPTGRD